MSGVAGACVRDAPLVEGSAAFLLSVLGAALSASGQGRVDAALQGVGQGGTPLDVLCELHAVGIWIFLIADVFWLVVVFVSTFDIDHAKGHELVHLLSSSRSLCICHICAWCAFTWQLVVTSFIMVALCLTSALSFVCQLGGVIEEETQELVDFIRGAISGAGVVERSGGRSRMGFVNPADTPGLSLAGLLEHLNVHAYCGRSRELGSAAWRLWLGCLVMALSQALMCLALSGEKERVSCHELKESEVKNLGYIAGVQVPGLATARDTGRRLAGKAAATTARQAGRVAGQGRQLSAQVGRALGSCPDPGKSEKAAERGQLLLGQAGAATRQAADRAAGQAQSLLSGMQRAAGGR